MGAEVAEAEVVEEEEEDADEDEDVPADANGTKLQAVTRLRTNRPRRDT